MKQRTVSIGWQEDVHALAAEVVRLKEDGERTVLISLFPKGSWISAIVIYEQDGGAE